MRNTPVPGEGAPSAAPAGDRRWFLGLGMVGVGVAGLAIAADRMGLLDQFIGDDSSTGGGEAGRAGDPGLPLPPEADRSREVNLLGPDQWKYTPGVKPSEKGGLAVAATGLAIRSGIGTDRYAEAEDYEANPPVNRYGVHLKTDGNDFAIAGRVGKVEDGTVAKLDFASAPPYIFDERRDTFPTLSVYIDGKRLVASIDGKPQEIALAAGADGTDFWAAQQGDKVVVGTGDKTVSFDSTMFKDSREAWFGLDASEGGTFNLEALQAYPMGRGNIEAVDTSKLKLGELDPEGFQAIANRQRPDLMIGTALDLTPVARHESYAKLVGANVGVLKTEMLGKMQGLVTGTPDRDGFLKEEDFVFDDLDAFFDLAERNDKKVHLHTVFFNEALPVQIESVLRDVAEGRRPKEVARNLAKSYATILLSRYKDRKSLYAVDVINEPLQDYSDDEGKGFDLEAGRIYREGAWFKALGKEMFELGFQTARDVLGKDVLLGFNEFGAESDEDRAKALVNIFSPLARRGLADFAGLQSHLDRYDFDVWSEDGVLQEDYVYDETTTRINQFGRGGLKVMFSELSIDSGDEKLQRIVSRGVLRAVMDARNAIGVCWWGLATGDFYMTSNQGSQGNDAPWAWENGRPVEKETVRGIKEGLGLAA